MALIAFMTFFIAMTAAGGRLGKGSGSDCLLAGRRRIAVGWPSRVAVELAAGSPQAGPESG